MVRCSFQRPTDFVVQTRKILKNLVSVEEIPGLELVERCQGG